MGIHKETFFQEVNDGIPSHWVVQYWEDSMVEAHYCNSKEEADIFEKSLDSGDMTQPSGIFMHGAKMNTGRIYGVVNDSDIEECKVTGVRTIKDIQLLGVTMVETPVCKEAWIGNCESIESSEKSLIDTSNNKDNKSEKQ